MNYGFVSLLIGSYLFGAAEEVAIRPLARVDDKIELSSAVHEGNAAAVERILQRLKLRPDDFFHSNGDSFLMTAAYAGHDRIVRLLLAHPCVRDSHIRDYSRRGYTPLYFAVAGGYASIVEQLLPVTRYLNMRTADNRWPLRVAVEHNDTQICALLLNAGCDTEITECIFSYRVLHMAAIKGHEEIVKLLLAAGCQKDAVDKKYRTPLYHAIKHQHSSIVSLLLQAGCNKEIAGGKFLLTPLQQTIAYADESLFEQLVAADCDIHVKWKLHGIPSSCMHLAVFRGSLAIVERLRSLGLDPDESNEGLVRPLHIAVSGENDSIPIVGALLAWGCNPHMPNAIGITPLHIASYYGHHKITKMLLEAGCNPDAIDVQEKTPLHRAAKGGYYKVAATLVHAGCDIQVVDHKGRTALHFAVEKGHYKTAAVLISAGCNMQVPDSAGRTALHVAAEKGHARMLELLC